MTHTSLRVMLVFLGLLAWAQQTSQLALSQPAARGESLRVRKILHAARKLRDVEKAIWSDGPPKELDEAQRLEWAIDQWRACCSLYLEIGFLFVDEPCPEAVAEMLLKCSDYPPIFDMYPILAFPVLRGLRASYLEALEGADKRLKDKLPELRRQLVPHFDVDFWYLRERRRPLPAWYVDQAFDWSNWSSIIRDSALEEFTRFGHGIAPIATMKFMDWDHQINGQFFSKDPAEAQRQYDELCWSLHVIETYGVRRRYNRVQQNDAELAKKQLKWLWETKMWWARRYVVEVLKYSPELAFEGIIEELGKENHPYVGPRITELKLVERLKEQRKDNN